MSIWDKDALKGVDAHLKDLYNKPDTMTFKCEAQDCKFTTSVTTKLFDYNEKEQQYTEMAQRMKKHKDETGHEDGSVYHNGKKFLKTFKQVE